MACQEHHAVNAASGFELVPASTILIYSMQPTQAVSLVIRLVISKGKRAKRLLTGINCTSKPYRLTASDNALPVCSICARAQNTLTDSHVFRFREV